VPVIAEMRRVLRPDGLVMVALFGVDTLTEFRDLGGSTIAFPDLHDIGDALQHSGFDQPVVDVEKLVFTYSNAERWIEDVRATGFADRAAIRPSATQPGTIRQGRPAAAASSGSETARTLLPRGLRGRAARTGWTESLQQRLLQRPLTLTFEIIYAHAWAPEIAQLPPGYAPIKVRARGS
jgi:malonyl-CoA O-methyltransferase